MEFPVIRNSKKIELFLCDWGGPEKVDEKNIGNMFIQTKNIFGQKFKIIYFFNGIFGAAEPCAHAILTLP